MGFSNAERAGHGSSAQESLEDLFRKCLDLGYLADLTVGFRAGKEGYSDKQFYAAFLVEFNDNIKWAIYSTTSMRTDRLKEQQWDALNLKEIDPSIKKAYLVFPDSLSEEIKKGFIRKNNDYMEKKEYSALDAIVSQDRIYNMIEEYAMKDMRSGKRKGIQGSSFEVRVAAVLSNAQNIKKWKSNNAMVEGLHYDIFEKIVGCFGLDRDKTETISATYDKDDIGKLPSGGSPKTDVLVRVCSSDGTRCIYTISCKRSGSKKVSVHEYTAKAFADVLDPHNDRLRHLLELFQERGSKESFGEENSAALTRELAPYVDKLTRWAIGGYGGGGDQTTQCAGFILTYDSNNNTVAIDKTGNYCKRLINSTNGQFGTPFSWTYPSKRRGKRIQLKGGVLK